jgi:hypothetical protein
MTDSEPQWHSLAIHGPNRWSRRPVLELYLPQEVASRPFSKIDRVVHLLQGFLDAGRFTTTHVASVSTARSILEKLQ